MEAKELMIGDWVMQDDNLQQNRMCQITGIYDNVVVDVTGEKVPLHESHIEPIPLTDAILKANGFNREGGASYWHEGGRDACVIHWSKDKEQLVIGSPCDDCMVKMNVRYIHELQHAFILARIEKEIVL